MIVSVDPVGEFIERGYTVAREAIPAEFVAAWWEPTRRWLEAQELPALLTLGTHLHFPRQNSFSVDHAAPQLAHLIRNLLSNSYSATSPINWGDGFAVALPSGATAATLPQRWHKDGFFWHYLDSPEIGLVCLVLWTDVEEQSGATLLAEGSVTQVARLLRNRPEGVHPDTFGTLLDHSWPRTQATGHAGDVYLLHPFLLHARQVNRTGRWRAISNPALALSRPASFLSKSEQRSAVEEAVVHALGGRPFSFVRDGSPPTVEPTEYSKEIARQRRELSNWIGAKRCAEDAREP